MSAHGAGGVKKKPVTAAEQWWDDYFTTQWEARGGRAQSAGFMAALLGEIPRAEWQTIVDIGCALGDGTALLATAWPGARVIGIDISGVGIHLARASGHAGCEFHQVPLDQAPPDADLMTCSNVLEHCADYLEVMARYLRHCRDTFALLVPYRQEPLPPDGEHAVTLDESSFPETVGGFRRVAMRTIAVPARCWHAPQLCVIYRRTDE